MKPENNISSFQGTAPLIHDAAFVDDSARVIGDVTIGEGVSIWPMAVIRADEAGVVIREGSAILDLCLLESPAGSPVTIGEGSVISHGAIVHGASIASGVLVGAGAIVLDDAVVCEGSIIGAGAVVTPRAVIPPNSLVLGSPARVVRETTPEEREGVRAQARGLFRKSRAYLAER
jgi:carbonic anhydrase/acetyltransferase-like protein (isoleucine patch superfamily)